MQDRLKAKGWSEEEINHAQKILKRAEKKKHPHIKFLDKGLFWFILLTGIIGTIISSFILIPVFISSITWSYILTALFGLLLGTLIIIILKDLHWFEGHHRLSIYVFVPVVAVVAFLIVVNRVNKFAIELNLDIQHNPLLIGLTYLIGFILPYLIFLFLRRRRKR